MNPASDLVNKLWRLCAVLRKDGITYLSIGAQKGPRIGVQKGPPPATERGLSR